MPRLTRAESQARTREQLIATAKDLFLRDGYAVTSLEKVADAAGYSKGAVYSNFRNKDELCLAVLDAIHAEQAAAISAVIAGAGSLEERLAGFQGWAERTIGDQAWTALEVEFALHARRHPHLMRQLAERDRAILSLVADLISENAAEYGIHLPMSPADTATVLLSLGIGLGVQRAVDPTIRVSVLTDLIRAFAGGTTAPGAGATPARNGRTTAAAPNEPAAGD